MRQEPEEILNQFKERLLSYIGIKIELFKLDAYERIAKIIAILSHSLILMLLALFLILFLFFTLAFFLGEVFNRISIGFLIVVCIYLILFTIAYYMKKRIQTGIMNMIIGAIQEKEEEDNDEEYNTSGNGQTAGTQDSTAATDRR